MEGAATKGLRAASGTATVHVAVTMTTGAIVPIAMLRGWEEAGAQLRDIRAASVPAATHRVMHPDSPSTLDSGWRGEQSVRLVNLGRRWFTIERRMRIAQRVFSLYVVASRSMAQGSALSVKNADGLGPTGV